MVVFIVCFVSGLLLWTFLEYLIHGILSHRFKTPVSTMHWQHHREPRRVFTSPVAPLVIVPILWWVFSLVIGKGAAAILMLGTLCGFAYYEYAHWRIHFREPKNKYQERLKAHHMAHHFCNARLYHGVSTHFWDKVFDTLNDEETREAHYAKSIKTPVMEGESNLREIYTLQGLKTVMASWKK
jgi:hypothetical protein